MRRWFIRSPRWFAERTRTDSRGLSRNAGPPLTTLRALSSFMGSEFFGEKPLGEKFALVRHRFSLAESRALPCSVLCFAYRVFVSHFSDDLARRGQLWDRRSRKRTMLRRNRGRRPHSGARGSAVQRSLPLLPHSLVSPLLPLLGRQRRGNQLRQRSERSRIHRFHRLSKLRLLLRLRTQ